MATFSFSLVKGTSISFRPSADILNFDVGSAAGLDISVSGRNMIIRLGSEAVTLLNVSQRGSLTSSNVKFADGSLLLVGDNSTGTSGDSLANTLIGGAGNDQLIGLGGNDYLDGRDGGDTYVVVGTSDGTDIYRDTGIGGIDQIVAAANNAVIRLGTGFSQALTGIEAISANLYAGVSLVGTSGADTLNFDGVSLSGLALVDAAAGADTVTGSASDDRIRAGTGNDTIFGGAGNDTALFAGTMATYSVVRVGDAIVVKDLATATNGNDGTDTLFDVEYLQFLDGTMAVPAPPAPPPPPTNNAPTAVNDSAGISEGGGSITIDVLANDSDPDANDSKRVLSVDSSGTLGSVAIAADGLSVIYTVGAAFESLAAGASATDTFAYTMVDSAGAQASATVSVLVTGINDAPVANADAIALSEDVVASSIAVLANDIDVDAGDTKRVISVDGSGLLGSVSIATNGLSVVYRPSTAFQGLNAGQTTTETFTYTMADSAGAQSTATATVTINGVNDAPFATADSILVSANQGPMIIDVLSNDTDVDVGDTRSVISVSGAGTPGWMELILIYGVGVGIWHPGTPAILGTVATAPDHQSIVYATNGAFAGLGAGETALETITYVMTDGHGAQSSGVVSVTVTGVNDGPVANADSISIAKNAGPTTIDVLANDSDPDTHDSKRVLSVDTTGTLGSVTIAADGHSVVYTVGTAYQGLAPGATATDTFTYTIVDNAGAQSQATVTVTISGTNTAPQAAPDTASVNENGAPLAINVLANDVDADAGDTKRVIAVDGAGLQGSVSIAPGGTGIVYAIGNAFQNLAAGATATETFNYTMVDSGGAQSSATVTVLVTGINDAPVAVANSATVSEDAGPIALSVLANDVDVDSGDILSVVALGTTGLKGSVALSPDQTQVIYTPFQSLRAGQTATDTFSHTVADGSGARSTATVTMTVTGANDAPVAVANTITLSEDAGATTIAVLANDTDVDAGDTKRVISVDGGGLLGSVSVATNGTGVVYSPGAAFQHLITGQTATETFSYTMADAAGAQSSATVTVTINGITDGPKAVSDTAVAAEDGGPITINVLANDFNDADPGGELTITSIDGTGQFASLNLILIYGVGVGQFFPGFPRLLGDATIAPDGHSIVYTPLQSLNAGEVGVDQFKYTITGPNGGQSTGVVAVTVTGANDAPEAHNDVATVASDGTPLTINVLANDTDPDTRIDPPPPPAGEFGPWDATPADIPDTKTVIAVDGTGLQGSVSIAPGGSGVIYTVGGALAALPFGATATETFSYTMRDGGGLQSTATVTVTVTGANHRPVAVADTASAIENGAPVAIDVLANDSDADLAAGDSLRLLMVDSSGLLGSATINGSHIDYSVGNAFQSLRAGVTATDVFGYAITDDSGTQATANVTVTVTGVNDAPVAVADGLSVSEDASPVQINLLANDIDVDAGDTKTITAINATGLQGSVVIAADGSSVVYTVGAGFQALLSGQTATDSFSYTMTDSAGAQSSAVVSITIVGANEPVVYVAPPPPPPGAVVGSSGDNIISGTSGADVIYGQAGDDDLDGGAGNDSLYGGADDDALTGGDGNDILVGEGGRDDLTGDAGADVFRFYRASDSTSAGFDRVRDFSAAEGDKIDLNFIDANEILGGNNDFSLVPNFTGAAGQLTISTSASGLVVQGDVTGDAQADFVIEVRLASGITLTEADFIM